MKKINKTDLPQLWERLAASSTLYLPLQQDGIVNFGPWQEGATVDLDCQNTTVPPKNIIFPQSETYTCYEKKEGELKLSPVQDLEGDYIIFGMRPCDMAGFEVLDRVFMEEPEDGLYASRRSKGLLVSLACNDPDASCFCSIFELEPGNAPGADIMLWDLGETLLWKAQSEKGETLTQDLSEILLPATSGEIESAEQLKQTAAAKEAAAAQNWTLDGVKEQIKEMFDSPLWDELYRRCLGCGICTYLCPTCHCFDIEDYHKGQQGERFRCWDSCMFKDFTLMASGENPRPSQKERVRQRFMHKLSYFPARNNGLFACVGCGRCVRNCPVSLDITQVIKEAGGISRAK